MKDGVRFCGQILWIEMLNMLLHFYFYYLVKNGMRKHLTPDNDLSGYEICNHKFIMINYVNILRCNCQSHKLHKGPH